MDMAELHPTCKSASRYCTVPLSGAKDSRFCPSFVDFDVSRRFACILYRVWEGSTSLGRRRMLAMPLATKYVSGFLMVLKIGNSTWISLGKQPSFGLSLVKMKFQHFTAVQANLTSTSSSPTCFQG